MTISPTVHTTVHSTVIPQKDSEDVTSNAQLPKTSNSKSKAPKEKLANTKHSKKKCVVTLGTGYELQVSRAKMHHLRKKWLGTDPLLPKDRIGILKRYEMEYEQNRNEGNGCKVVKSFLKRGENTTQKKPPHRPKSAPLFRYIWNIEGEIYIDEAKKKPKRKRPVSSMETAASRSRREAISEHLQKVREKQHNDNISFLHRASQMIASKQRSRIRNSSSSPLEIRKPYRSHSSFGSSHPYIQVNDFETHTKSIVRAQTPGQMHKLPKFRGHVLSRLILNSDLNDTSVSHINQRFMDSSELPDYEIENGDSIVDHIYHPEIDSFQEESAIYEPSSEPIQLDDLEKELDSYFSLNSIDSQPGSQYLNSKIDLNKLSEMDKKLFRRAKLDIQMEKEMEAKRLGLKFSRKIKSSVLTPKRKK